MIVDGGASSIASASAPLEVLRASEALHARVRVFIAASMRGDAIEPFDALALDLARYQATHVRPFARLVRARGIDLVEARSANAIPAVPADVFRLARVAAHPPELDVSVFRTSGTTRGGEARGEHAMRTTSTYEASALAWGARHLFPERSPLRCFVLAPSSADAPDSSLSFMVDAFARALGDSPVRLLRDERLDAEGLSAAAADARAASEPVIVFGASFAFVHLFDAAASASFALPEGSRVMQTGGFKGRSREVDAEALRREIAARFAVDPSRVIGEYGMTELSSQLYEATLSGGEAGVYVPPPWLRVEAAEPTTLEVRPRGELGIARFVDLANVDSAVAVQTADVVRVREDGGVELFGRAKGAAPRGCSLAIDAMLERP